MPLKGHLSGTRPREAAPQSKHLQDKGTLDSLNSLTRAPGSPFSLPVMANGIVLRAGRRCPAATWHAASPRGPVRTTFDVFRPYQVVLSSFQVQT